MLGRLNRPLLVQLADQVRARLGPGLAEVRALGAEEQQGLCEAGGGRMSVIALLFAVPSVGLIEARVRRSDLLLRLGGDTLIVVAPGLDARDGRELAARLARVLDAGGLEPRVGLAQRSRASCVDWSLEALAAEAASRAVAPQPA